MESNSIQEIEIKLFGVIELLEALELDLIYVAKRLRVPDVHSQIAIWPETAFERVLAIQHDIVNKTKILQRIDEKLKEKLINDNRP